MADEVEHSRRGLLRGPSRGVIEWTDYWIDVIDWLIDARRRWHEGRAGPGRRPRPLHLAAASAPGVAVLVMLAMRAL